MAEFDHKLKSNQWEVVPVPALQDNYMYLIIDHTTNKCVGVDGVEPQKLLRIAEEKGCEIEAMLTTHSHWDHDGGNEAFAKLKPGIPIIGGRGDGVKAVAREVSEQDLIKIGRLNIAVLETPFHTRGHVCYQVSHADNTTDRAVFTGDTLFVGGCGNLNNGTKAQLLSAFQKLGKLDPATKVYCGHEYTTANFNYAKSVEPNNEKMLQKLAWATERRSRGLYTIPSTIQEEHDTSPFMRAAFGNSPEIEKLSKTSDLADNILFVRQDKSSNQWKQRL